LQFCFTASADQQIRVWNLRNQQCVQTITRHTDSVNALMLCGPLLLSAGADEAVKVFAYRHQQQSQPLAT
jgi:WD40 repeat protein